MWTKAKSATLTLICTRILIGITIAVAAVMPFAVSGGFYGVRRAAGILFVGYLPKQ